MPPKPTPTMLLLLLVASTVLAIVTLTNIAEVAILARQAPLTKYQGWDTGNPSYAVRSASASWVSDSGLNTTIVQMRITTGQWFNATFTPALYGVPQAPVQAWLEYDSVTGSYASCLNLTAYINSTLQARLVEGGVAQASGPPVYVPAGSKAAFNVIAGSSCYVPPGQEVARVYTWLAYRTGTVQVKQRIVWIVIAGPTRVWLADPQSTGVSVALSDSNTRGVVTVYLAPRLELVSRNGTYIDLTNSTQVSQYFTPLWSKGCSYTVQSDGTLIVATGEPGGGLYGGCFLGYKGSFPTTGKLSVYALLYTDDSGSIQGLRGISFYNTTNGYYYLDGFRNDKVGATDVWYYTIAKYNGTTGQQPIGIPILAESPVGAAITGRWQSVVGVVDYTAKSTELWVNGSKRLAVSDPSYFLYPNSFAIGTYKVSNQPTVKFKIVGVTQSSIVKFTGLDPGCAVYVYSQSGALIASGVADSSGVALLTLTPSIIPNATVKIACSSYTYTTTVNLVMGGDTYAMRRVFAGRILNILSNLSAPFTSKLILLGTNCTVSGSLVSLYLYNSSGSTSTPIQVSGSSVASWTTGTVSMSPPASWSGSWPAGYWYLSASLPGSLSACYLDVAEPAYLPDSVQVGLRAVLWLRRS